MNEHDESTSTRMRASDMARTRVMSDEITVDGDRFAWWGVGNGPVLVTVSHPILGKKAQFTHDEPRRFAESLARALLAQRP